MGKRASVRRVFIQSNGAFFHRIPAAVSKAKLTRWGGKIEKMKKRKESTKTVIHKTMYTLYMLRYGVRRGLDYSPIRHAWAMTVTLVTQLHW